MFNNCSTVFSTNRDKHKVYEESNLNVKTVKFHLKISNKVKKHFHAKHVKMSSLDNQRFTQALKQLRNEMHSEFYKK